MKLRVDYNNAWQVAYTLLQLLPIEESRKYELLGIDGIDALMARLRRRGGVAGPGAATRAADCGLAPTAPRPAERPRHWQHHGLTAGGHSRGGTSRQDSPGPGRSPSISAGGHRLRRRPAAGR